MKTHKKRILEDITDGQYVSLSKFGEILDMFKFLPLKREYDKNQSSIIYEIMSGGNLK